MGTGGIDKVPKPRGMEPLELGDYIATKEIGKGAISTVYKGHHKNLPSTPVAIKTLSKGKHLDRLKGEAQALDGLLHEHIIRVLDVEFEGEHPYIALEYAKSTLRKKMRSIEWRDAVRTSIQIGKALQHAHSKGVIHRDVKPENILYVDNTPKISDFNSVVNGPVASLEDLASDDALRGSLHSRMTVMDGQVYLGGTIGYMPPEQQRGEELTKKADVYSLAAVLYEMLTGNTPEGSFKAPSAHNNNPKWLDRIILESLDAKYQSRPDMSGFVRKLEEGLAGKYDPKPTPQPAPTPVTYEPELQDQLFTAGKWATLPIWGPFYLIGKMMKWAKEEEKTAYGGNQGCPTMLAVLGSAAVLTATGLGWGIPTHKKIQDDAQIEQLLQDERGRFAYVSTTPLRINYVDSQDATKEHPTTHSIVPRGENITDITWIGEHELAYTSKATLPDGREFTSAVYRVDTRTGEISDFFTGTQGSHAIIGSPLSDLGFDGERVYFRTGNKVYTCTPQGTDFTRVRVISSTIPWNQQTSPSGQLIFETHGTDTYAERADGEGWGRERVAHGTLACWNPYVRAPQPPTPEASSAPIGSATIIPIDSSTAPVGSQSSTAQVDSTVSAEQEK